MGEHLVIVCLETREEWEMEIVLGGKTYPPQNWMLKLKIQNLEQ